MISSKLITIVLLLTSLMLASGLASSVRSSATKGPTASIAPNQDPLSSLSQTTATSGGDVLSEDTTEDVYLSNDGDSPFTETITVPSSALADGYRQFLAAPSNVSVDQELPVPQAAKAGFALLPIRDQFYDITKKDHVAFLGLDLNPSNSGMTPRTSLGEFKVWLSGSASFLRVDVQPGYPNDRRRVVVGLDQEGAERLLAGHLMERVILYKAMLQSIPGRQAYQLSWVTRIHLPSGSVLQNGEEIANLSWMIGLGSGSYGATASVEGSSTVVLRQLLIVTEGGTTSGEMLWNYSPLGVEYLVASSNTTPVNRTPGIPDNFCILSCDLAWDVAGPFGAIPMKTLTGGTANDLSLKLTAGAIAGVTAHIAWDFDFKCTKKKFGICYWGTFVLDWFKAWVEAKASAVLEFEATATARDSANWVLDNPPLLDTQVAHFMPFPGVFVNINFQVIPTLGFSADGPLHVVAGYNKTLTALAGFGWDDGWYPILGRSDDQTVTPVTIDGNTNGTLTASLKLRLAALIEGLFGPFIEVEPYATASIKHQTLPDGRDTGTWEISLNYRIGAGITFGSILSAVGLGDHGGTIFDDHLKTWSGRWGTTISLSVNVDPSIIQPGGTARVFGKAAFSDGSPVSNTDVKVQVPDCVYSACTGSNITVVARAPVCIVCVSSLTDFFSISHVLLLQGITVTTDANGDYTLNITAPSPEHGACTCPVTVRLFYGPINVINSTTLQVRPPLAVLVPRYQISLAGSLVLVQNVSSDDLSFDSTPPVVQYVLSTPPNVNGWNNQDVTLSWNVTDADSPILSSSGCETTTVAQETPGIEFTCTATNSAGLSASASVTIRLDKTPPTISSKRNPGPNDFGWNSEDVTVYFPCTDALSGVEVAPADITLTTEGSGQSATGECRDEAGNRALASRADVNIDKTPPALSGSRSPDPNEHGWNNQEVTVHFSCSDSLSGVSFISRIVPLDQVSANTTLSPAQVSPGGVVQASGRATFRDGRMLPAGTQLALSYFSNDTLLGIVVAELDVNGGYSASITAPNDTALAALFSVSVVQDLSAPVPVILSEGAGQEITGDCNDLALNDVDVTVSDVNIDLTAPVIRGSRTPLANSFGWNNVDVRVSFACSDALSGVAVAPVSTKLVSTEGASQSREASCVDVAGNSASATVGGISIDKTPPTITINAPARNYILNEAGVFADWSANDALSGIDTAKGTLVGGAAVDTSTPGPRTFTVSATDKAGNTLSQTVTYSIIYSQTCGRTFLSPLEQVSSASQLTKKYMMGSSLPVKFKLCDANGNFVGSAIARVNVFKVSNAVDTGDAMLVVDSGSSHGNTNICRSTANQYVYNLSTNGYTAGTYRLKVDLDDGTSITTYFQLSK